MTIEKHKEVGELINGIENNKKILGRLYHRFDSLSRILVIPIPSTPGSDSNSLDARPDTETNKGIIRLLITFYEKEIKAQQVALDAL